MAVLPFTISYDLAKIGGRMVTKRQWKEIQRIIKEEGIKDSNEAYRRMLINLGYMKVDGSLATTKPVNIREQSTIIYDSIT